MRFWVRVWVDNGTGTESADNGEISCPTIGASCASLGDCCAGLKCVGDWCRECVASGNPCTSGDCCANGLVCRDALCREPCGAQGATCAGGDCCADGLVCRDALCRAPCGAQGATCAEGDCCADGLVCRDALCREPCGAQEATCAGGDCCGDPGGAYPETLDLSELQLAIRKDETDAQGVEVRFIDTAHFSFVLKEGTWRDWEDKVPLVDQAFSTLLRRYVDELNTPAPLYKVVIFVPQASGLNGSPRADLPALSFSADRWPELLQEIQTVGVDRVAHGGLLHELTHTMQRYTAPRTDHDQFGWFNECHAEMTRAWYSARILRAPTWVGCSEKFLNSTHLYLGTTRSRYCSWLPFYFMAARHGMAKFNGLWQVKHTPDALEAVRAALGLDTPAFNAAIFQAYLALATQGSSAPEFSNLRGASALVEVLRGAGEASARVGGNAMVHHLRRVDGTTDQFEPFPLLEPQRLGFDAVPLHVAGTGVASFTVTLTMTVPQPNPAWVRRSSRFDPAAPQFRPEQAGWLWCVATIPRSGGGAPRVSVTQTGLAASVQWTASGADSTFLLVVPAPTSSVPHFWDQAFSSVPRFGYTVRLTGAGVSAAPPVRASRMDSTVAPTATVDDTVVLHGCTIRGRARVHGLAQLRNCVVEGDAVVGACTWAEDCTFRGNAVVECCACGRALVGLLVEGTARLLGDVEFNMRQVTLSSGTYSGFYAGEMPVNDEAMIDPEQPLLPMYI